jgi:hypothetical protein
MRIRGGALIIGLSTVFGLTSQAKAQQNLPPDGASSAADSPTLRKVVALAEGSKLQQLRGLYNSNLEDWVSTLQVSPFKSCVIDKDTDEGSTIYTFSCSASVSSVEEGGPLADQIEAMVESLPGVQKRGASDLGSHHSQRYHSKDGALISVRRPLPNKGRPTVVLSVQPPSKD